MHEKGEVFVCVNTFLFSKCIFKKFLSLGAVCHPYTKNVLIPFFWPILISAIWTAFLHIFTIKTVLHNGHCGFIQYHRKLAEHPSFTCLLTLFNKRIRISVVVENKKAHSSTRAFLGNKDDLIFLVPLFLKNFMYIFKGIYQFNVGFRFITMTSINPFKILWSYFLLFKFLFWSHFHLFSLHFVYLHIVLLLWSILTKVLIIFWKD